MPAFFLLRLPLFSVDLHQEHDAVSDRFGPARGRECADVAHSPEIQGHRPSSAPFVRIVAVQKDSLFVAAHPTAGLDLHRLPLEKSRIGFCERT